MVRLGDEDHVDVARVVELAGTALAHRHDREPDRRGVRWQLGAGDREGGLEHRVGEVGEFLGDLVHGGLARQVAAGEVQDPAVVGGGQFLRGVFLLSVFLSSARRGLRVGGVGRHGAEELLADRLRVGAAARLLAAQHGDVPRVADQVVGHGLADAEDGGQPRAELRIFGQRADQAGVPLGDLRQAGQGEVRVGGLGEEGEQRMPLAGDAEGGELALGLGDVGEAHPREPAGKGGTRAAHGNERIPAG